MTEISTFSAMERYPSLMLFLQAKVAQLVTQFLLLIDFSWSYDVQRMNKTATSVCFVTYVLGNTIFFKSLKLHKKN